ncbi:hypothetical protein L1D19_05920 [Vibrio natriegens]|uniref:hypothetical protein n=1 Tax=Vibrio natriegens TaxID=691 RepID=UPI001EFEECD4|nr:hypothetical protein [Vibrio natriegens]MCG9699669.1 hypothetical protein [Vibrio natriegens]
MKNADMPAMPQTITDSNDGSGLVGSHMEDEWQGLTKREYFALHAPECPGWFRDLWVEEPENESFSIESSGEVIISFAGELRIERDWRYKFADLMLEDGDL